MKNRREFLLEAGITLAGMGACSDSFQQAFATQRRSDPVNAPARSKMRGLMVDAGRVPESIEYYRRVIEFCADWQLNALHFRLADDQGSALRFNTVPELLTHKNSFTPEQLRSLADYAKTHGVDLIPELESFGHTGYITRSPAYAHLLDTSAEGSSEFNGICPVNPESLSLFARLYHEVTAIFPSVYLHGGCDEVNWGGSALSRKALETKTRSEIWAEYLNALNQLAEGLGKQLIVWGDVVLHNQPDILGSLSKNVIIMDWNYSDTSSAKVHDAFLKVRANGSRAIGAPALIRYEWGPRAGSEQLRNIDAFADSYLAMSDPASLGVILTNWIPSRYLQSSIWDGFAYAAITFNQGSATARTSGFHRFVERHYQSEWNDIWDEAFHLIYDNAPYVENRESSSWMGTPLRVPWSSDEQLAALLKNRPPRSNPYTRLRDLLGQLTPSVRKNLSDFQSFSLCVEYLEAVLWRESVIIERTNQTLEHETATQLIQSIAQRDQTLLKALTEDWDKGRPADSPEKSEPLFGFAPKDQLLFQWTRAAAYSTQLAAHPERFYELVGNGKPANAGA